MAKMLRVMEEDPRASRLCKSMRQLASSLIWQVSPGPDKDAWIQTFLDSYSGQNGRVQLDQFCCYILQDEVLPHLEPDQRPYYDQILEGMMSKGERDLETIIQELKDRIREANLQMSQQEKSRMPYRWLCLLDACLREQSECANSLIYNAGCILSEAPSESALQRMKARRTKRSMWVTGPMAQELQRVTNEIKDEFFARCRDKLIALAAECA